MARFAHSDEKTGGASAVLSLCGIALNLPFCSPRSLLKHRGTEAQSFARLFKGGGVQGARMSGGHLSAAG